MSTSVVQALVTLRTLSEESREYLLAPVLGLPLLTRTLLALQKAGIREVFIWQDSASHPLAAGTHDSRLRIRVTRVTGDLHSLRPHLSGDLLLVEGLLVFDPRLLPRLLTENSGNTLASVLTRAGETLGLARLRPLLLDRMTQAGAATLSCDRILREAGKGAVQVLEAGAGYCGEVHDEESLRNAERGLLHSQATAADSAILDCYVTRRLSPLLTRVLLKTPLTPTQVTLGNVVIGLTAAWTFSQGSMTLALVGLFLYGLFSVLDCCDGELARLRFQESRLGSLLDVLGDDLVHVASTAGIALGLSRLIPGPVPLLLGVGAVLGLTLSALAVLFLLPEKGLARDAASLIHTSGDMSPGGSCPSAAPSVLAPPIPQWAPSAAGGWGAPPRPPAQGTSSKMLALTGGKILHRLADRDLFACVLLGYTVILAAGGRGGLLLLLLLAVGSHLFWGALVITRLLPRPAPLPPSPERTR